MAAWHGLGRAIHDDEAFERVNRHGYVSLACGRTVFQWQQLGWHLLHDHIAISVQTGQVHTQSWACIGRSLLQSCPQCGAVVPRCFEELGSAQLCRQRAMRSSL